MVNSFKRKIVILIAAGTKQTRESVKNALEEINPEIGCHLIATGPELLSFLRAESAHGQSVPGILLLDTDLKDDNGVYVLEEIKADTTMRRVPVVGMIDAARAPAVADIYKRGVNSVVLTSADHVELVKTLRSIVTYWFEMVQLPPS